MQSILLSTKKILHYDFLLVLFLFLLNVCCIVCLLHIDIYNPFCRWGVTTMRALTIVLTKWVVLTDKTASNIKKRRRTTEYHFSSHIIMRSVIYPTSFVRTEQPYKNTHNCAKSSKNHPSWLLRNPKVWKISWWELTSPLDLPTLISVNNVIRDDVWRANTSNAHTNSAAHIQE